MKRLLSHRFRQVYYLSSVPEELRSYEIKEAEKICLRFEGGLSFHQEHQAFNSKLELDIYKIDTACKTVYSIAEPETLLHYMLQGSVNCKLTGYNGLLTLKENRYQLFYLSPKTNHQIWFRPGLIMSFQICLSDALLEKLPEEYQEIKQVIKRKRKRSERSLGQHIAYLNSRVRSVIQEILVNEEKEPDRSVFIEIRIMELLRLYIKNGGTNIREEDLLLEIRNYIHDNLDKALKIEELARKFGISSSMLKKAFKKRFYFTIHQYIMEQRLEKARRLLLTTSLPIKQIAADTGLGSSSNFTVSFHEKYGLPPSEFRQKNS